MTSECECDRAECGHSFPITLAAYESVRASGRRFVVATPVVVVGAFEESQAAVRLQFRLQDPSLVPA